MRETVDVTCAAGDSTCQKRVTVCEIYDVDGNLLACESNRCSPIGGVCHRLGIQSVKEGYPSVSTCNWDHAEARAVAALPADSRPYRAVLYGHEFLCGDCEVKVRGAGVDVIEIVPETPNTGVRPVDALAPTNPHNAFQKPSERPYKLPNFSLDAVQANASDMTLAGCQAVQRALPLGPNIHEHVGVGVISDYALEKIFTNLECPTLVVNLFAGPGAGKSTLRAGIFYRLKLAGINCEEAPEYAKDKTWQEDEVTLGCQFYVTGKQIFRLKRLRGKVRVVITDSPILIGLLYQDADCGPSFPLAVLEQFDCYDNLNYLVQRSPERHQYNPKGRKQSEAQSMEKDDEVAQWLEKLEVQYTPVVMDGEQTVQRIVADILARIGACGS